MFLFPQKSSPSFRIPFLLEDRGRLPLYDVTSIDKSLKLIPILQTRFSRRMPSSLTIKRKEAKEEMEKRMNASCSWSSFLIFPQEASPSSRK